MFTNGTGTGKSYVFAGIAKRFIDRGKKNILVVAPSHGVLDELAKASKANGFDLNILPHTQTAGDGPVATTYAGLRQNIQLAKRNWDLVVADESHNLMASGGADVTGALSAFRAITNHPNGLFNKARMLLDDKIAPLEAMADKRGRTPEGGAVRAQIFDMIKAKAAELKDEPRSKAVFLSATPFPYDQNIDYAEGYLFDYGPEPQRRGYNTPGARDSFFMQHFGYRMRYGKLTKPDAHVISDLMERQFHEWMRTQGSLSGRVLTVDKDYDRKFVLVDDGIGKQIDQAMDFLFSADENKFADIQSKVMARFDYLSRMQLLEAIKAHHAVDYIKGQQALGRKVVVFHDYNVGGGFSPFELDRNSLTPSDRALYDEFLERNPYVAKMDFSHLGAPIGALKKAFPDALLYNGTVPNKERSLARRRFNDDADPKANLIVVRAPPVRPASACTTRRVSFSACFSTSACLCVPRRRSRKRAASTVLGRPQTPSFGT